MPDPDAPSTIALLVVVTVVLGIVLPILVARRTGRPEDLRERVLLSRPGRVEAVSIGVIVVQGIAAIALAALAVVAHPILWVVAACSASSVVATSVSLHRFRRTLHALEAEIAGGTDAEADPGSSVSA